MIIAFYLRQILDAHTNFLSEKHPLLAPILHYFDFCNDGWQ